MVLDPMRLEDLAILTNSFARAMEALGLALRPAIPGQPWLFQRYAVLMLIPAIAAASPVVMPRSKARLKDSY